MVIRLEKEFRSFNVYSYNTKYLLYEDVNDIKPKISYEGKYLTNNKAYNLYQFGTLIIQDGELNVTIDSVEREIIINRIDSTLLLNRNLSDLKGLINSQNKVDKKVVNHKEHYMIQLGNLAKYKAVEIVNENNKMTELIFYTPEQELELEDGTKRTCRPKLIIEFSNYTFNDKVDTKLLRTWREFLEKNGDYFQVKKKYEDYKLIDLRIK